MEWKQRRAQSRAKPKYQRPQHRLLNQNQSSIEDSRPWIEMHIESWRVRVARPRMQMDSRTASHQRRQGKRGKQVVRRPLPIASTWSRLVEREATASADTGKTRSLQSTIHRRTRTKSTCGSKRGAEDDSDDSGAQCTDMSSMPRSLRGSSGSTFSIKGCCVNRMGVWSN